MSINTIKIHVENWKGFPEGAALEFVLKEVTKDLANGLLKPGKGVTGNYYNDNGIEYRATIS